MSDLEIQVGAAVICMLISAALALVYLGQAHKSLGESFTFFSMFSLLSAALIVMVLFMWQKL